MKQVDSLKTDTTNTSDPTILLKTEKAERENQGFRYFIAIRREIVYHFLQVLVWLIACIFSQFNFESRPILLRCVFWLGSMVAIFVRFFMSNYFF